VLISKVGCISCLQQEPRQFTKDKEEDVKMLLSPPGGVFSTSIASAFTRPGIQRFAWQYLVTRIPLTIYTKELGGLKVASSV